MGKGALIAAAVVLAVTGFVGWQTSRALDERTAALAARSATLTDREAEVSARAADLSKRAGELAAQIRDAETAGARVAADRVALSQMQAAIDAQLAYYQQAGCTVWVAGHDAHAYLLGSGQQAACDALEAWLQSNRIPTLRGVPALSMGIMCRGSKSGLLFAVRDTGGLFYGTRLCDGLTRWAEGATFSAIAWRR